MTPDEERDPLVASGLTGLSVGCDLGDLAACLRRLPVLLNGGDPLDRLTLRGRVVALLETKKINAPGRWVDAALFSGKPADTGRDDQDPEPAAEPVDGAELLASIAGWLRRYVHLPEGAADAMAAWVLLTWMVDVAFFAPLLVILSATKQCGKTLLLGLLRPIVYRGKPTFGTGITAAVIFRLNERDHPTLLIDEAEKLAGRQADKDLVAMLNVGYRRGAKVQRCAESGGKYEIEEFDAFGFRALAAIGTTLWDTVQDRGIVAHLERKPRDAKVARFAERIIRDEGALLARQVRRWADEHRPLFAQAEADAPRPRWLTDRGSDNWSGLFAIGALVGGDWPARLEAAARSLHAEPDDEADDRERLVHDLEATFRADGWPEVIKSGDLVQKLNAIETAPWGDYRKGDGLSTHRLARLMRAFKVAPRFSRGGATEPVRGYWLQDLQPVFARYLPEVCSTVAVVALSGGSPGSPPEADAERAAIQGEGQP